MAASVLLHALIGVAFALNIFSPAPAVPPAAVPPALLVTLTARNPQMELPPPPAPLPRTSPAPESLPLPDEVPDEESALQAEEVALQAAGPADEPVLQTAEQSQQDESPAVASGAEAATDPEPAALAEAVDAVQPSGQDVVAGPAGVAPAPADTETSTPALNAGQLETAVATFMRSYRGSLMQDYVGTCLKYQNRYGSAQPCPDEGAVDSAANTEQKARAAALFETHVTRATDNARYSRRLAAESKYLETLLDDTSVLGAVAQQRYLMVRDYYCLLNGGEAGCKMTQSPTGASGFTAATSEVISLVTFGGGGLRVLNGLLSIDTRGRIRLLDFAPAASAMPFTHFEPRLREAAAAEEDVEAFVVEPPLFPLR